MGLLATKKKKVEVKAAPVGKALREAGHTEVSVRTGGDK